jgi:mRNA interferase MazF
MKNFNDWNLLKINIDNEDRSAKTLYFHEREIWWASLGLNIGHEQDGKNINFERPVLVIKKFNQEVLWIVPLTSKLKANKKFYYKLTGDLGLEKDSVVIMSQIKLISCKRLLRKIGNVSEVDLKKIIIQTKDLFPIV